MGRLTQWAKRNPLLAILVGGFGCLFVGFVLLLALGFILLALGIETEEPNSASEPKDSPSSSAPEESTSAEPSPTEETVSPQEAMVAEAEKAAKAELPDAPIWKGVRFKGTYVNDSEVCVDRTWPKNGGIDGKGGSAGFVVVAFPDLDVGEPKDGTCAKPAPEPVDYAAVLQDDLKEALGGGSNRGVARLEPVVYNADSKVLIVTWAIDDNITEGLTKTGAKLDVTAMLEVVQENMEDGMPLRNAIFRGTYILVDQLGNESEDEVVQAEYSAGIIKQINFENFLHDNVYEIADRVTIHPAFQE